MNIIHGNAADHGANRRGWFVGHFMGTGDIRKTEAVEFKWGVHKKGEKKASPGVNDVASTVTILISGGPFWHRFYPEGAESVEIVLEKPSDYILNGPGIPEEWEALGDTVMFTARWPSKVGDQRKAE